ncbi:MAG: DNA topoisomerase III, partial [Abditibacteriota bacterium]|nr:DNA topoisomerase III [Abditibacteriota bacterium]
FIERKKTGKAPNLIPTPIGTALVAVLPETLKSSRLTVEWERRLTEIKRGELAPDSFTDGIAALVWNLWKLIKSFPARKRSFRLWKKPRRPAGRL